MCHSASHEFLPLGVRHNPVEEIAFNRAIDSSGAERFARQEPFRVVLAHLHNGQRDALGDDHEKRVLNHSASLSTSRPYTSLSSSAQS